MFLPGIIHKRQTLFFEEKKRRKKCGVVSQASHSFGSDGSAQRSPESQMDGISKGSILKEAAPTSNVCCFFASAAICLGRGKKIILLAIFITEMFCPSLFKGVLSLTIWMFWKQADQKKKSNKQTPNLNLRILPHLKSHGNVFSLKGTYYLGGHQE